MLSPAKARAVGQSRILLTGFDPFGGQPVNPSWQAVQALHGREIEGHQVVAAQIPTVFNRSLDVLAGLLESYAPGIVLCTGQAGGRAAMSLERVAINVNDARIADNAGAQPVDTPVVEDGPAAYFTTLPIKAMLASMLAQGIRADVSQTAGTFVCNHVFYGLMHMLATDKRWSGTRGGMVHVPWLPQQGQPSMTVDQLALGLEVALQAAVGTHRDLKIQAGAIS
jgi:pyroglutamyl-peptidase